MVGKGPVEKPVQLIWRISILYGIPSPSAWDPAKGTSRKGALKPRKRGYEHQLTAQPAQVSCSACFGNVIHNRGGSWELSVLINMNLSIG